MMVKIKFSNGRVNSLTHMLKYTKADKDKMISTVLSILELRSDDYTILPIDKIWVEYKIADYPDLVKPLMPILENRIDKLSFTEIKEFKLPNTMDITLWSDNIRFLSDTIATFTTEKYNYDIVINEHSISTVIRSIDTNKIVSEFVDTKDPRSELDTFIRQVGEVIYTYVNGELIEKSKPIKVNFIKAINISKTPPKNKIITIDLESKIVSNNADELYEKNHKVVAASVYDGVNIKSFYLLDYNSSEELLIDLLTYLKQNKYSGYKVYAHNLSFFDGIFLLKLMPQVFDKVEPIFRDKRFISIKATFGKKRSITFIDSLLLLNSKLDKLAKAFNVERKLDYDLTSLIEGTFIVNESNRKDLLNYNVQDCIVLHQVMCAFSNYIYELFKLDISKYPTLPSLAFAASHRFVKIIKGFTYNP